MVSMFKTNKFLIFVVALVAVILTVVGSIILLRPAPPSQMVTQSPIGDTITQIVPDSKLVSMMVTPSSEAWWDRIDYYVPSFNLDTIAYNDVASKAINLGWSISYSNQVQSPLSFGLNTIYLEFETEADATASVEKLTEVSNNDFQAFSVSNIVAIIPTWAFSDLDYTLENYDRKPGDITALDRAAWVIQFDNFFAMNKAYYTPELNDFYEKTLTNLGFTGEPGTTWSGSSKDGLNWTGTLSTKVWNYENIDTEELMRAFNEQREFIPFNPELQDMDPSEWPRDEGEIYGIEYPHQALLLDSFTITSTDLAFGQIRNQETAEFIPATPGTQASLVTISTDPNLWIAAMSDRMDAPPLFKFALAEFTFNKNSTSLDIKFTEAIWADEL